MVTDIGSSLSLHFDDLTRFMDEFFFFRNHDHGYPRSRVIKASLISGDGRLQAHAFLLCGEQVKQQNR